MLRSNLFNFHARYRPIVTLTEKSSKLLFLTHFNLVFLSEDSELEELLEDTTGYLSHLVDFLAQLLKQRTDEALVELGLISSDICPDFYEQGIITLDKNVNDVFQSDHGFLADPGPHITASIDLVIIQATVENFYGVLHDVSRNLLDPASFNGLGE